MFRVRINDIFFINGQGMVLAGRVESGKVFNGARAQLRTPMATVPTALTGLEQNRKLVWCVSAGDEVALMIREIHPSLLLGGVERIESTEGSLSQWRVLDLVVEEAPKLWWEFWK